MRIGLLQCDDVAEELRDRHGNYPQMFADLLGRAAVQQGIELEWQVWRCLDGDIPEDVDAVDAWLTTGSKFGVNDGLAWVEKLEGFVRQLWVAGKPLVGICFGHQLIARALGGEVIQSPKGWGVGLSFNQVSEQQAWMTPSSHALDLLVSHQDQVTRLPDNTRVLGGSPFCPNYLIQAGDCFLGVQGHPEFSPEYSRDLMQLRRSLVGDARVREGLASLSSEINDDLMALWILAFMREAIARQQEAGNGRV
ncbi:glutamine amidotransferase-related protein [Halomonas huangheensis]|uniref:Glutamine amidotransferase domain-containing protein n=1 Tax=Halomonas huangheensis TaxID=1178482 RepID=W1N4A1_9GAMM|nr:gamma-glutamyl-gamma-aminobutyrate hydrolase family protein [Halomonas huangheensis]ALM51533.1 glutamine amidotransferase [Halomonas huangheensis]ERL50001.1 hypothetical protein BJB45_02420 [Halomonas huangheensis]